MTERKGSIPPASTKRQKTGMGRQESCAGLSVSQIPRHAFRLLKSIPSNADCQPATGRLQKTHLIIVTSTVIMRTAQPVGTWTAAKWEIPVIINHLQVGSK